MNTEGKTFHGNRLINLASLNAFVARHDFLPNQIREIASVPFDLFPPICYQKI